MIHAVQHEQPIPPRAIDPSVPRDLETVILNAIEKDPARRYATAEAMADDLLAFREDREIRGRRTGPVGRAWRFARRNRSMATLLAALAATLVGGCSGMAVLWARAEHSAAHERLMSKTEAEANSKAREQSRIAHERAEDLASQDYLSRISRATREVEDGNVVLAEELLHGCPPERRGWEWHYAKRLAHL